MRKAGLLITLMCLLSTSNFTLADTFGSGDNRFSIDFLTISGDASSANGTQVSPYTLSGNDYKTFTDPGTYRIGKFEITNNQWDKFKAEYGPVTGNPTTAYRVDSYYKGSDLPTNGVSWLEAAQFVNWLNTNTGHQPAYKFTGTKGTSDYTLTEWDVADSGYNTSNPYRNSHAIYVIPNECEWVKAAYWNGTYLQSTATRAGESLHQGDGLSGSGWNYDDLVNGHANVTYSPWAVGSGSEELNGTFDMMGNVWEWVEDPYWSTKYGEGPKRRHRGGTFHALQDHVLFSSQYTEYQISQIFREDYAGFRVVSLVPEPATLLLLALGGMIIRRKK